MREPTGDHFSIGKHTFTSRLIVGTGKYRSFQEMARAHQHPQPGSTSHQPQQHPHQRPYRGRI